MHESSVPTFRQLCELVEHRALFLRRRVSRNFRKRREQRSGQRGFEIAVREPGEAVLERDRLALLGQLQPAGRVAGGLREDRRMRRSAASARTTAASVEDRQLDVGITRDLDEPFLRAVDRPLRSEEAAVLAGVGIADHHLEAAVAILHASCETRIGEQLADDGRRAAEVRDRLEQGNDGEPLVAQIEDGEDVGGGRRAGDDHRVERFRSVSAPDVGGGCQRVACPRARLA